VDLGCHINLAEKQRKKFSFILIYKFINRTRHYTCRDWNLNSTIQLFSSSIQVFNYSKSKDIFYMTYKFMNKGVLYKSGKIANDKVYINYEVFKFINSIQLLYTKVTASSWAVSETIKLPLLILSWRAQIWISWK